MEQLSMQRQVCTWDDFRQHWAGFLNFRIDGECRFPDFPFPPIDQVVDEVRRDPDSRIWRGAAGDSLDKTDIAEEFRAMSLAQAMESRFQMSHFKLNNFFGPGQLLHRFDTDCLIPWLDRLKEAGFTFERYYPIFFISGRQCSTNFHIDPTNVVAWQIYGTKFFHGTQDPERWAPYEMRMNWRDTRRPPGITEADLLTYRMSPGDMLWNAMLTPHWVEAGDDEVALSMNLAIDGLRLNGELCPHERELREYMIAQGLDVDLTGKAPGDY